MNLLELLKRLYAPQFPVAGQDEEEQDVGIYGQPAFSIAKLAEQIANRIPGIGQVDHSVEDELKILGKAATAIPGIPDWAVPAAGKIAMRGAEKLAPLVVWQPGIDGAAEPAAQEDLPDWAREFARELRDKLQEGASPPQEALAPDAPEFAMELLGKPQESAPPPEALVPDAPLSEAPPLIPAHTPIAELLSAAPPADDVRFDLPGGSITIPGGDEGLRRIRAQAQEWMRRKMASTPERLGVINEPDPNHPGWKIISQEVPMSRPDIDEAQRAALELDIARQALANARNKEAPHEGVRQIKASDYATLQRQARFNAMLAIQAGVPEAQAIAQIAPTIERMNDMAAELGMPMYNPEEFYYGVKNGMAQSDPLADLIGAIDGAPGGQPVPQEQNRKKILERLGLQ